MTTSMEEKPQAIGNYVLGKTLGSGTTGKVKLATRMDDQQEVAMKIIKKSVFDSKPEFQRKIRREIALMRFLDHPHLIKLEEVCESPRHLYIVIEYAPNGELFDFLVARRILSAEQALRFFRQIVYGLDYLHTHGFCHRDLKPENIMLDANNQIKIGDFGFARWMRTNVAETSCGSPHYAAPEVIRGIRYDGRCADVWSAGVILYALLCGKLPFDDSSIRNLLAKVKSGNYYMPDFPKPIKNLISRMLTVDPNQRITIQQIKEHPAFKMYVPETYVFPEPIPLPYIPDPIDISDVDQSVIKILLQLGYQSEEDVKTELTATDHNMAKVFFMILMHTVSLKTLPWKGTATLPSSIIASGSDVFFDLPQDESVRAAFNSSDPFRRPPRGQPTPSLESYSSLNTKTIAWNMANITKSPDVAEEEQDATLDVSLEQFFDIAERSVTDLGYEFFHPDDLTLVCRRTSGGEVYLLFNAGIASESKIGVKISRAMGTEADFAEIRDLIMERLHILLGGEDEAEFIQEPLEADDEVEMDGLNDGFM